LPHYATLLMWAALVFLTAIYLGVFSTVPDSNLGKIGKVFSLIILIYGAILVFGAFTGGESPLNPLEFTQKKSTALATRFRIINNADELNKLFERSANEHKIILLDFSADWCHACIALDKNIFSNPEVQNVLEDEFMMLRVDLTDVNSEGASLAHQFNIVAPPAILFFNENNEQLDVRIENDISAEKFITVLNNILSRKIKPIR